VKTTANSVRSAHVDTFCAESLPPRDMWPVIDVTGIPDCQTEHLNCASTLLDDAIGKGWGERVAYLHAEGTWSYRKLHETANRIANVLVHHFGLVPGNRVLLRGFNHPMLVACWFGVIKAGGVVVNTNPLLRSRELTHIASTAKIDLALCDHRVAEECKQAFGNRTGSKVVLFGNGGRESLEIQAADEPTTFDNCNTAADDVAIIAFTSGTTGRSKGTMHFHRDLIAATECFPKHIVKPISDDIFCGTPPLAFTYALGGLLLFPMRIGAATLLLEQTTPAHLLQGIQDNRASVCFTAPTAYRGMLKSVKNYDVSSLRKCVSAGEPLPAATFEAWLRETGLRIIDGIGSTEMLHIFIGASEEDMLPGATGKVCPGYRARVVGKDGKDVPIGTVGKLTVQGPTGCRYLNNLESQQLYVQNGWNLTGDAYRMDADGYFWFQGRTDDMIISSGYNISGVEVESVLLTHPKVAECAVIGVPDEERGQIVKACIVPQLGIATSAELAHELQDFVKSQIAPYKYPRAVEFMDALPKTNTGKIQRYVLRQSTGKNRSETP
jgi:2-aminobenzoate-CoA ligase